VRACNVVFQDLIPICAEAAEARVKKFLDIAAKVQYT